MANLLVIFNHRIIPKCILSLEDLEIEKCWIQYFDGEEACIQVNKVVCETDYDNYILVADDVIVYQPALNCVQELLKHSELATGYCKLAQDSPYVNTVRLPLTRINEKNPVWADYYFHSLQEIAAFPESEFITWFGGWSLTGISRSLLLDNPIRTLPDSSGCYSDYDFSFRMGQLGKHFISHKQAYIEHIKPNPNRTLMDGFSVGKIQPRIRFNKYACDTV